MAASDNLHPVQFHRETTDSDIDRHAAEADAKGRDEDESFGYSAADAGDYLWDRSKGKADMDTEREVF